MNQKNRTVAFTGHRKISWADRSELRLRVASCVKSMYEKGVTDFICGAAWGFDLLAAEVVVLLRKELPGIRLICALPYRAQAEQWSRAEQSRHRWVVSRADEIVVLSEHYFNGCFLRRNDYMLNRSSAVIAYFNGQPRGGTFYTIRKASANGLNIVNLYFQR